MEQNKNHVKKQRLKGEYVCKETQLVLVCNEDKRDKRL